MRNLRLGLSLIGLSIFTLLILNYLPGPWADEMRYADSTFGYVVMGLIYYFAIYFLGLQSLESFRLPRIHFKTLLALMVASFFVISDITGSDNVHLKPWVAVRGIVFLLAIGFGEGSEQNAPLGRAVIGGLLFATVSTVLFVPVVFASFHRWLALRSANREVSI